MDINEILASKKVYRKDYIVETYNTSFFQTIKVSDLFKYLQEVASLHSESMKIGYSDLSDVNGAWVLTKQKLEVVRLPRALEKFTIHTWSYKHNKIVASRNFLVTDAEDNILIKAVSDWVVLNLNKRRIIPLSKIRLNEVQSYDYPLFSSDLDKIEIQRNKLVNQYTKKILFSDIDINGHMNNTAYIDMVLDSVSEYFSKYKMLKVIDTNFIQEVKFKEEITINSYEIDENTYHHEIFLNSDQSVLFTAITKWGESC